MRTLIFTVKQVAFLLLFTAEFAFSQAPTYNVYLNNESYPAKDKFQFDIWIKKTGAGDFQMGNFSFSINVNASFITGTITPTIVGNSSMLTIDQAPQSTD